MLISEPSVEQASDPSSDVDATTFMIGGGRRSPVFPRRADSWRRHDLAKIQDVAGYLFAVVGTHYAEILGLIAVDSMSMFSEARLLFRGRRMHSRTSSFSPHNFPATVRGRSWTSPELTSDVTEVKWPMLAGKSVSPEARKHAVSLSLRVLDFGPNMEREQETFAGQIDIATQ